MSIETKHEAQDIPPESQESARKAEIVAHAGETLDGQANARRWLQKPNQNLNGKTPLDVLNHGTAQEVEEVDQLLYRLEYGMYS